VFLRRAYGSGVLASRPGPARASGGLARPVGLAWRLQRGPVIGWGTGMFLGGVGYGTLGDDVESLLGDSDLAKDMFAQSGGALIDAFYATMILMLALIGAGFAISSALRPHGEEDAGRIESLLATGLRRRDWLLGHVAVTLAGTALMLLVAGIGMGVGYALVTGEGSAVGDYVLPTMAHLPGVLVLAAVARLLFGLMPRAAFLSWLGLVFCLVVMMFAPIFRMPQWLQDVSPFEHLALMPAEDFRLVPFVVVTAVATALSVVGQVAFQRRDVR
jgi:ABC-2 type transport system permease protein